MTNIVTMHPTIVGNGLVLDPDAILDAAKGELSDVVIIGTGADGNIQIRASHGSRHTLWQLQAAIFHLMQEC